MTKRKAKKLTLWDRVQLVDYKLIVLIAALTAIAVLVFSSFLGGGSTHPGLG